MSCIRGYLIVVEFTFVNEFCVILLYAYVCNRLSRYLSSVRDIMVPLVVLHDM